MNQARPSARDHLRAIGPGAVSGASDTDPTTVATVVVVGATTTYGLAWLALWLLPVLAVVQILATRVGLDSGRDLQQAVVEGYGRGPGLVLLGSVLGVNVLTIAADLQGGAAAVHLLTGWNPRWVPAPLALALLALLLLGSYHGVVRVLRYVMLCLLAYAAAAVLARPDRGAVVRGTLVPSLRLDPAHLSGVLALLGTTLTAYMYLWQAVEQLEEPGRRVGRQVDAVVGALLAGALVWFILVASGATLGVPHRRVDTAAQAAQALRPVAGRFAGDLFAVGLLTSAVIALPVIAATGGYAAAAQFGWVRGLSRPPRRAPRFYAVIAVQTLLGTTLALGGFSPIGLLYAASLVAGVATPLGLVLLVLVAANPVVMRGRPVGRGLRAAGWLVALLVSVATAVYLARELY
ncbi:MAG TPA: divalent metal cation transporter [Rugosimonospora sp.]|nr:divalent metal cation transporter [Rugosimonospora sp.]